MEIERIEIGLPISPISNADVVELVNECSKGITASTQAKIKQFLRSSGACQRFWRHHSGDPRKILQDTTRRMLHYVNKKKIKVVIYCSATKYFADPAHASLYCSLNELSPQISFDVSDGCMGWVTALFLLNDRFGGDLDGYGLIVSHEFPMGGNGAIYPRSFRIETEKELEYKLPALTLGEACTLTLVRLNNKEMPIARIEIPEGASLCTLPFRNYEDIMDSSPLIASAEEFQTYYKKMSKLASLRSVSLLNNTIKEKTINLIPHSYATSFEKLTRLLNFDANVINYFSEYGNTATSSIPLNLETARIRKNLDLTKPTYVWCASAGIKIAVAKIDFSEAFN